MHLGVFPSCDFPTEKAAEVSLVEEEGSDGDGGRGGGKLGTLW